MNCFGTIYRLTTFGESHGPAIGGVIDGVPPRFRIDMEALRADMARRRPGRNAFATQRDEADEVEFLSGISPEGLTLGSPIGFLIRNTNQRAADYDANAEALRPCHADYTYLAKYGIRDPRGGGRASARETASRCVAGAIARQILESQAISITAWLHAMGTVALGENFTPPSGRQQTDASPIFCPDPETSRQMEDLLAATRRRGDSVGGLVKCVVRGVPAGLGEPVGQKLHAMLASAMMSINAAKGFEYGLGFAAARAFGSQAADAFCVRDDGSIGTLTNHSGGIQGGISNSNDINFAVAFKPTPTLLRDIQTITPDGRSITLPAKGRHDPCVAVRAVPVVEAMAAITILDAMLMAKATLKL